jgi:(p)ppGpp synthase/HD superfamily hydrolase
MKNRLETAQQSFSRDLSTLEKLLRGGEYRQSLICLGVARDYHPGLRKDRLTPNFHHQVRVAFSAYDDRERFKAAGLRTDDIIAGCFLHDTYEENQEMQLEQLKGLRVNEDIVGLMHGLSKIRYGVAIPTDKYYEQLLDDPRRLVVKLYDRRQNVESVFGLKPEKVADYFDETNHLLEVAKRGRLKYPELEGLIQHSRNQIKQYLVLIRSMAQMVVDGTLEPYVAVMQARGIIESAVHPPALRTSPLV